MLQSQKFRELQTFSLSAIELGMFQTFSLSAIELGMFQTFSLSAIELGSVGTSNLAHALWSCFDLLMIGD